MEQIPFLESVRATFVSFFQWMSLFFAGQFSSSREISPIFFFSLPQEIFVASFS